MGLFKSDTVPKFWDIALAYNNVAGDKIIELLQNNPHKIRQIYGLESVKGCSNALLNELRCYTSITSLAEVGLPLIDGESSESERIMKAGTYEWGTAHFELEVFRRAEGSADWVECGVAALKNAGGFRYRIHRILDLVTDNIGAQVGEWGRIGVRIRTVGYGYPQSYDRISFTGNWTQEFTWVQEHPTYVVINQYGGSAPEPTPEPTPTPTPTPPPAPTFSLASGSTAATANNDEKVFLTITSIEVGTELSGKWFKAGVDTGIGETVTVTGNSIELSTLKLGPKLSGNYSLQLFYNGVAYMSNEVAVVVNPEITLSLPSGITTASTGSQTSITVEGKFFPQAGNQAVIYQLLKTADNSIAYTSTESGSAVNSPQILVNGGFTFTINSSVLATDTSGDYRLKFHFDNLNTQAYLSKNTVPVTITAAPPTVVLSPKSVNTTTQGTAVSISRTFTGFPNGFHPWTWQKDGVDMNNGGTQYIASASPLVVSQQVSAFSTGNGVYRIKITANSVVYSDNLTITS